MRFGTLVSVGLIVGTASVAAHADPMSGAASDASATAGTAAQSTASSAMEQTSTEESSSTTESAAFDSKDSNGDGYITRTEAGSDAANYDRADSNRDGRLDRSEFAALESMTQSESTYDSSTDSRPSQQDDSTQEEEGTSPY